MTDCEYCRVQANKPLYRSSDFSTEAGSQIILRGRTLVFSDVMEGMMSIRRCEIEYCPKCGRHIDDETEVL